MSCADCDGYQDNPSDGAAYFRLGNREIGWGNIAVIACGKHARLLQRVLSGEARQNEKGEWV